MKLKVITLNCWGIPWSIPTISSPNRAERFRAIGEFLVAENYDFVFLQEVWDEQDYLNLTKVLSTSLPFSYYFKTGTIGSGTCIFSIAQIEQVFDRRFSINGFLHQVWLGDALAGSGIGAVQVTLAETKVLLCVTHFHAEYYGEFKTDRAAQAWEARNFIKLMAQGGKFDLLILAGDFNSLPGELPHRILSSCLKDCWQGNYEITFGNMKNSYAEKEVPETLDYIFVKEGSKVKATVSKTCLPLEHTMPDSKHSYSDHEALETELLVENKERSPDQNPEKPNSMCDGDLKALTLSIKTELCKTEGVQDEYMAMSVIIFIMIMVIHNWVFDTIMAFIFCFCFVMAAFTMQTRKVALQNILQQVQMESKL